MKETVVDKLKVIIKNNELDGYLVPSTDEYQGEYVHASSERLKFITNFTGSFGLAIIFANSKSILLTDGRYLIQSKMEVNLEEFEIIEYKHIASWKPLLQGKIIGFNPMLFTKKHIDYYESLGVKLSPIEEDLIDILWEDKPPKPLNKIYPYSLEYAGEHFHDKVAKVRQYIKLHNAKFLLTAKSENANYLLNIRGNDLKYTPIVQSCLLVGLNSAQLFINMREITTELKEHFGSVVNIVDEEEMPNILKRIDEKIIISDNLQFHLLKQIKNPLKTNIDFIDELKSQKNNTELEHIKEGHIKDAIAVNEFLAWLDDALLNHKDILNSNITELSLIETLENFRKQNPEYLFPSFETICGFESNGAIVHYRCSLETNKRINKPGILLIDSGGQYMGCTTDITRTVGINPTNEQKKDYTKVLKGHINLASAVFPQNINANALDTLARIELWKLGENYNHGTGHGVGSFLSVHESPPSLNSSHALKENMVLSIEPGLYRENKYGIRIENLVYVSKSPYEGFLKFENLTLVPYCNNLINYDDLNNEEKAYVKEYYSSIKSKVMPYLSDKGKKWLNKETAYILSM